MTAIGSRYRGTIDYQRVTAELVIAARYRGTTTYQAIAVLLGLPLKGSHMGREVGQVLGEISEDEHKLGRPMLSAVAVNSAGRPGFLPKLRKAFTGDDETFLRVARLALLAHVRASGVVERVLHLRLGPITGNRVAIEFRGRRQRVYDNVEPATIEVSGMSPLNSDEE